MPSGPPLKLDCQDCIFPGKKGPALTHWAEKKVCPPEPWQDPTERVMGSQRKGEGWE